MYKIGNFRKVDCIAVLCRGKSLDLLPVYQDRFHHAFTVGQFQRGYSLIKESLLDKKVVPVINKVSIKLGKSFVRDIGIKDIQCNFGHDKGSSLSTGKTAVFKRIKSSNPDLKTHLHPVGLKERRAMRKDGKRGWATTGLFAVDLACWFRPKKIMIFGLDFYDSKYFVRESTHVSEQSNRKRGTEMSENLTSIVQRDRDIEFELYTYSRRLKSRRNLKVFHE